MYLIRQPIVILARNSTACPSRRPILFTASGCAAIRAHLPSGTSLLTWSKPNPTTSHRSCRGRSTMSTRFAMEQCYLPILKKLHSRPNLNRQAVSKGLVNEFRLDRRALVELTLGRAMATLGDAEGY